MPDKRMRNFNRSRPLTLSLYWFYAYSISTFSKRVHRGKSKVEPATDTVAIVTFEIYFASPTVS